MLSFRAFANAFENKITESLKVNLAGLNFDEFKSLANIHNFFVYYNRKLDNVGLCTFRFTSDKCRKSDTFPTIVNR